MKDTLETTTTLGKSSDGIDLEMMAKMGARAKEEAKTIDGYVNGLIRPKPRWMPFRIYQAIIRRFFVLQKFIEAKDGIR